MRRALRRLHVLFWALVLAGTSWALAIALGARHAVPLTELPESISEEAP